MSHKIDDELLAQLKTAATERGIDPDLIKKEDVSFANDGSKIRIKWRDVEIEMPAPSQESVDSWFDKNGAQIAGGLIALGGVAITGIMAVALATALGGRRP